MPKSGREVHPFVESVARELDRLNDQEQQDRIDVLLLGGSLPARELLPESGCWYCRGGGWVCPCHGLCSCGGRPLRRCECVRLREVEDVRG